jgi:2-C-methyl-D-erythritol 2,4-cyclodiphosphate synthase
LTQPTFRSGIGYDTHRLAEGRKLILGGVEIPSPKGLMGHSDADVLSHAICDALLGAAALGDIGQHFPDSDPQWKGAGSLQFLVHARGLLEQQGWRIANVDSVIVLDQPKLASHMAAIRENVAAALGVDSASVSVKAKTSEGVFPEIAAAQAVVLLTRNT